MRPTAPTIWAIATIAPAVPRPDPLDDDEPDESVGGERELRDDE
ncbi:MAG: hypothetical protein ACTIIH_05750 [Brevibacterium sp.]